MTKIAFDPVHSINTECEITRGFIDVLQREQSALRKAEVSMLLPLAQEKTWLAQQLAQLSDARKRWLLARDSQPADHSRIKYALQGHPGAAEAWRELVGLAETASRLNKINGKLVGQHLRYNQQAIAALQQATQFASLYGANGHTQPFIGGRQLGEV